jgi:hypothetical protein
MFPGPGQVIADPHDRVKAHRRLTEEMVYGQRHQQGQHGQTQHGRVGRENESG